ncbi:MAG: YsnF/AvaK domain-containing protein [Chloroflexota bacterium]|nr:YsnF/AvaK domain-containing protein [Chloroflexota bacterium]
MTSQEHHILGQHRDDRDTDVGREESGATVQLRQEELVARKQAVDAGRVSVGTSIVQEHQTLEVPVTREEVTIERHAVDRRPSDTPISATSDTFSVPVHEEQLTTEKHAVVYEELNLGKRAVHDKEQVSATVRKEVVDVDTTGDVHVDGQGA